MKLGDFSRQSFLGEHSEETLAQARVAIVGLGGGGSHIAQQLAHIGVGEFRLFDPDIIEASNLNRLVTATQKDVDAKRPKVEILKRYILRVRPWTKVMAVQEPWQDARELLRDAHVVFGCVDSFQGRKNLEALCRRYLLPYIDIGMSVEELQSGHYAVSGQMIATWPEGPCLTCLGFITEERLEREEEGYGDAGEVPQVVWTNGVLASLAVGTFIQSVSPWHSTTDKGFIWLDLEGNRQTVAPNQLAGRLAPSKCPHFDNVTAVGDPKFKLQTAVVAKPRGFLAALQRLAVRLGILRSSR